MYCRYCGLDLKQYPWHWINQPKEVFSDDMREYNRQLCIWGQLSDKEKNEFLDKHGKIQL